VGGQFENYDLTSIGKKKVIRGPKDVYYHIISIAKNFGKEIIVVESASKTNSTVRTKRQKEQEVKGMLSEELKITQSKVNEEVKRETTRTKPIEGKLEEEKKEGEEETFSPEDLKFKLALLGVGVSLIDNEPKELIYMSMHEINSIIEKKVVAENKMHSTTFYISFNIGHIQVDNMLNKSSPVIFGPHSIFIVDSKKKAKEEDWQPFIQLQVGMNKTIEGRYSFMRFDSIQLQLSEMSAFIDLEIIMNLLKVVSSISEVFKPSVKLMYDQDKEKAIEYYQPQSVFPSLDPSDLKEPQQDILSKNKIFIAYLHLTAIKIRLSLRLEKAAVDPTGPLAVLEVLYSVVATLSNISDAPIYFSEIIMKNAYTPANSLIKAMQKKYIRQAIFQVYRILGSIDLIGNPIGLIDKLGSGVFEFFNEPRKGLLKGPKEFVKGLGKGVRSLVTSIVGGGLNSVSRVTGSLYSLVK
jgi:vacuolar protein sorting-associated protein 13A/C